MSVNVKRVDFHYIGYFLRSYIPLIILPLLVGTVLYVRTAALITEEVVDRNKVMLRRSRDSIESVYESLSDLSIRIAYNHRIMRLLNYDGRIDKFDIYKVRQAQQELARYVLTDTAIENVYVWFPASDIILTQVTTYLSARYFYEAMFAFDGLSYPQWRVQLLSRRYNAVLMPATAVTTEETRCAVIPYIQSIPIDNPGENIGCILVTYDEREIRNQLQECISETGGWAYIVDRDGTLITSADYALPLGMIPNRYDIARGYQDSVVANQEVIAIYDTSASTGWQFVSIIPKKQLLQKVEYLRSIMAVSALLTFLIGLMTAILLAVQKSAPLERLVQAAHVGGMSRGFRQLIEAVESKIQNLDESNSKMREEIRRNLPYITTSFFNRLLSGEFTSREEFESLRVQTRLDFSGKSFGTLIIKFPKEESDSTKETVSRLNVRKVAVRRYIDEILSGEAIVHDNGIDSLCLILYSDLVDQEILRSKYEASISWLKEETFKRYGFSFTCAGGRFCPDPLDLHSSFFEAKSVSEAKTINLMEESIIWFTPSDMEPEYLYYYPLNEEQRIITVARSGDYEKLRDILEQILERNFQPGAGSKRVSSILFHEMQATLIKCAREIQFDVREIVHEVVRHIDTMLTYEDARKVLSEIDACYRVLCGHVEARKKSHNKSLGVRIIAYIDENFRNSQLCLASISSCFHMSEAYFSQFFKEQNGENFYAYLERTRLSAANLLLREGSTVDTAAERVGYNSSNTFRRAYKRHFGISPSKAKEAFGRTAV